MLEFKEAIKKAFQHFEQMYEGEELPNKLLEEIEYDDQSNVWKVVIGFDSKRVKTRNESNPLFSSAFSSVTAITEKERIYKKIILKGEDGSLIKMQML